MHPTATRPPGKDGFARGPASAPQRGHRCSSDPRAYFTSPLRWPPKARCAPGAVQWGLSGRWGTAACSHCDPDPGGFFPVENLSGFLRLWTSARPETSAGGGRPP